MAHITSLRLVNFRNHEDTHIYADGRPVVLVGPNGAGKTHILEAISQLAAGRGLRGASLPDLIQTGSKKPWIISAKLSSGDHIGVGLEQNGQINKRVLRLNGTSTQAGTIAEQIRMFWQTPAMDRLFAGSAGDRRRFLDRIAVAFHPDHGRISAQFEKAMRERNALLERPHPDPAWLEAVETRMASTAINISCVRQSTMHRLVQAMQAEALSPFPKAQLEIDFGLDGAPVDFTEADMSVWTATYQQALASARHRDAKAGRTLSGPHRGDIIVHHAQTGIPAKIASTGQQKALLTAIILSAAYALQARSDVPKPLILLDEAGAHLDQDRREALFDTLCSFECQAWMTGTDLSFFEGLGKRAQIFCVQDGRVEPK